MTESEQAALDLLDEQQQMLLSLHDANTQLVNDKASLTAQLAPFLAQPSDDVAAAIAQRKEWFDAFRNAVTPAPAAPAAPASEPASA